MPDKHLTKFVEQGMIKLILDNIDQYRRWDTKMNLIKILTDLAG